jgi:hypothetical protein
MMKPLVTSIVFAWISTSSAYAQEPEAPETQPKEGADPDARRAPAGSAFPDGATSGKTTADAPKPEATPEAKPEAEPKPAPPAVVVAKPTTRDIKAQLQGGGLIASGFTAGVAVATQIAWLPDTLGEQDAINTGAAQNEISISPMPYVGWLPGRWLIRGDVTQVYCAAKWSMSDAQDVADSHATKKAFDRVTLMSDEEFTAESKRLKARGQKDSDSTIASYWKDWKIPDRATFLANPSADADTVRAYSGWQMRVKGKCAAAWIPGFYVGVPGKYKADVRDHLTGRTNVQEVQPMVSLGAIMAPSGAFSVMLGVTWSRAFVTYTQTVPGEPGGEDEDVTRTQSVDLVAPTVSIGANFDLASLLIK